MTECRNLKLIIENIFPSSQEPLFNIRSKIPRKTRIFQEATIRRPREYGSKSLASVILDPIATPCPNLSQIGNFSVPWVGTVLQRVSHINT